jgi:hypothetical protein
MTEHSLSWAVKQVLADGQADYIALYFMDDDDFESWLADYFFQRGEIVYSRSALRDIAFTLRSVIGFMSIRTLNTRVGKPHTGD